MSAGKSLTVGLLAGELSGDNLGAGLMHALTRRLEAESISVRYLGVGGARMQAAGLQPLVPFDRLSVNGFAEPIKRLPELLGMLRSLKRQLLEAPVDVFIGVDFNVFNFLLERGLKKRGVPTVHYVSPSVYAWRKGRAKRIGRSTDLLLTLYPFEPPFYSEVPVQAEFVGHPTAFEISPDASSEPAKAQAREELGLPSGLVVAVLPGSRNSEVRLMAEGFLEAAAIFSQHRPAHFVVPCVRPDIQQHVQSLVERRGLDNVSTYVGNARLALAAADAALVKSGTSTLEALCLRRPMVVSYRLGAISYQLARRLVHTPFVALPNILSGEQLVPELLQDEATPDALSDKLALVLDKAASEPEYLARFSELHEALRFGSGANEEAARVVHQFLSDRIPLNGESMGGGQPA